MATKTKRSKYLVQKIRGTKIPAEHATKLGHLADELRKQGYTVLDTLWAKQPGFAHYYAKCYRSDQSGEKWHGMELPAPMGVVWATICGTGVVNAMVSGVYKDQRKSFSFSDC